MENLKWQKENQEKRKKSNKTKSLNLFIF